MSMMRFNGEVAIEIQGRVALRQTESNDNFTRYEVVGLESSVLIEDYRSSINATFRRLAAEQRLQEFASQFNAPAYAIVRESTAGELVVGLHDTELSRPPYMLWVAVGISEGIPAYDYQIVRGSKIGDNEYSFFSIYGRPTRTLAEEDGMDSILNQVGFSS